MLGKVLKWVCLLCAVTLIANGMLYWKTGSQALLINIIGAAGVFVLSGIGLLLRKER